MFRLMGPMLILAASAASGQEASLGDANRFFAEGRELLARGELAEACRKFARSHELLPRAGTLLNLAVCLARSGENLQAFYRFQEALDAAIRDGRADREELARGYLEDLRSKLAWLTISVERARDVPALTVLIDDVPRDTLGSSIAIEPGPHVIKATAPGHLPFQATIAVEAGVSRSIEISPLVVESREVPAPLHEPTATTVIVPALVPRNLLIESSSSAAGFRPAGGILLGAGGAALVAGGFAGLRAMLGGSALRRACPDLKCTSKIDLERANLINDRARTDALVADVAIPVGLAAVGVGLYLWLSETPKKPPRGEARGPNIAVLSSAWPSSLSAQVSGSW